MKALTNILRSNSRGIGSLGVAGGSVVNVGSAAEMHQPHSFEELRNWSIMSIKHDEFNQQEVGE